MRLILLLLISDAYAYICHANRVVHAFTPVMSRHVFCDIFTKDTWKPLETRGNYQYEGFHGFPYHGNPWKPGGYLRLLSFFCTLWEVAISMKQYLSNNMVLYLLG